MNKRSLLLTSLCLGAAACADLQHVKPGNPGDANNGIQVINIGYIPQADPAPVHGTFNGDAFNIQSVLFAQGTNADGHQELQVALSDVANYCDVLSAGADADGIVARLRMVDIGASGQSLVPDANTFFEDAGPTWVGAVRDIPPPGAQAGATAAQPLSEGRHMTGGFARLLSHCGSLQLNPAFVGSDVILSSVDASGVQGSVTLWFSDTVGTTTGFALSGTFNAVVCPALSNEMALTPFAAFTPPPTCAPDVGSP